MGPICALLLGSKATSLYVDFDRVDPDLIPDIPQHDPRWLGAWWLGFLVGGCLLAIAAIPMLFYPKRMPKPKDADAVTQAKVDDENDQDVFSDLLQSKIDAEGENIIGVSRAVKGLLKSGVSTYFCTFLGVWN